VPRKKKKRRRMNMRKKNEEHSSNVKIAAISEIYKVFLFILHLMAISFNHWLL
jgi:cell division protein FtsL